MHVSLLPGSEKQKYNIEIPRIIDFNLFINSFFFNFKLIMYHVLQYITLQLNMLINVRKLQ